LKNAWNDGTFHATNNDARLLSQQVKAYNYFIQTSQKYEKKSNYSSFQTYMGIEEIQK